MNRIASLIAGLFLLNAAGCAVEGQSRVYTSDSYAAAYYEPPPLIMVEPGLYVVQGSAVPTYYSNGYYWHYQDGVWYQAPRWNDPWARVEVNVVPGLVVHRDHSRYVRFRGHPHAHVVREPAVVRRGHDHGGSVHVVPAQPRVERRVVVPVAPKAEPRRHATPKADRPSPRRGSWKAKTDRRD